MAGKPKSNEFKLKYPFAEWMDRLLESDTNMPIPLSDGTSAKILGKLAKRTKAFDVVKNSSKVTFLISLRKIERTSKTSKFAWFKF
jgi:hypothetical protein